MRCFYDLNIRDPGDPNVLTEMLGLASKLGFKGIALASESPMPQALRDEAQAIGIDLASRVDLRPSGESVENTRSWPSVARVRRCRGRPRRINGLTSSTSLT
jgi:hypothetical protein